MKPFIQVQVKTGGEMLLEGNEAGLYELREAVEQAACYRKGIGIIKSLHLRVARIPAPGKGREL